MIKKRNTVVLILALSASCVYADYDDAYEPDRYPPAPEYSASYQDYYEVQDDRSSNERWQNYRANEAFQEDENYYATPKRTRAKHAKTEEENNSKYEVSGDASDTKSAPLPSSIGRPREKVIIVDPKKHAWGAYSVNGDLVRWGLATAGSSWCRDTGRPCRTKTGVFRMYSLGDESCYSKRYPVPEGGAPMPYCMYFNGNEAIHGSNEVVYGNVSHGCVRVHVGDAEWLRYQFVEGPSSANGYRGTKVIVKPY